MVHKHGAGVLPKPPKPPKSGPVTVTSVDPDVLAIAWRIAEGNGARIEVISYNCLKVHNNAIR